MTELSQVVSDLIGTMPCQGFGLFDIAVYMNFKSFLGKLDPTETIKHETMKSI